VLLDITLGALMVAAPLNVPMEHIASIVFSSDLVAFGSTGSSRHVSLLWLSVGKHRDLLKELVRIEHVELLIIIWMANLLQVFEGEFATDDDQEFDVFYPYELLEEVPMLTN
jgi:hypothetical protein